MKVILLLFSVLFLLLFTGCGEKQNAQKASSNPPANKETVKPSDDSILDDGLKATLKLAAERAVAELSKPGGFADNEALRIRLPKSLAPVESVLIKLGQQKLLDDFTDSLNEAARGAVEASPQILTDTIRGMKMQDVLTLWKGGDDAATRFLETHTRSQIEETMLPIISKQTASSGATRYFKQISDLIPRKKGGLLDSLASLAGVEIPEDFDLDRYVSEQALDGLFATLATEEAKIRANPAARSTELIKGAFEYFSKQ